VVPDEVAVLGVDDDEILCELSQPPLSSIDANANGVGMRGAEILDRLLAGKAPPEDTVLVPPCFVVTRQSTSTIATEDPTVAAAMGFIRDHAGDGIHVDDVVASVRISRATLERRFRDSIGRSPAEEIVRIRMKRTKLLLAETDYKLRTVASLAGFGSSSQLVTAFKRITGFTPGEYRNSKK
jgi:LacI family transcriptional regulator